MRSHFSSLLLDMHKLSHTLCPTCCQPCFNTERFAEDRFSVNITLVRRAQKREQMAAVQCTLGFVTVIFQNNTVWSADPEPVVLYRLTQNTEISSNLSDTRPVACQV